MKRKQQHRQWFLPACLGLAAIVGVSSACLAVPNDTAPADKKAEVVVTPWQSQCAADTCTLSHTIGAQDADAIHAVFSVDKKTAAVTVVTFDVPADAEKVRGITISFGSAPGPEGKVSLAPGTSVVLALSGCDDKKCTTEIHGGKIDVGKPDMYDVTRNFLRHGHFFIGFYRAGNFVGKNMSLAGFGRDYAGLLAKIKSGK